MGSQRTSGATAAQTIIQARSYLNEATPNFWSDTEMLQWLNDGQRDIVSRSHCLQSQEDIDLIANQLEYTITSNYTVVKAVHYVDAEEATKGLVKGNPSDVGNVEDVEAPVFFYDWAGSLGIYPVLSSVTTEKITVYLVPRLSIITSADSITIPALYDKALVFYILAQAWAKDRQMAKSAQALNQYHAELDRYRSDLNKNAKEGSR
jgi:hypothetical protein